MNVCISEDRSKNEKKNKLMSMLIVQHIIQERDKADCMRCTGPSSL